MLVRNWKHKLLLLCLVKLRKFVGVVHPTKLKQNLRVFWKLMNFRDCVWEIRYRIIIKTILLQRRCRLSLASTIRSNGVYDWFHVRQQHHFGPQKKLKNNPLVEDTARACAHTAMGTNFAILPSVVLGYYMVKPDIQQ